MRARVGICLLCAVLVIARWLAGTPAQAHDHEPPRANVRTPSGSQRGVLLSNCWTSTSTAECTEVQQSFPEPLETDDDLVRIVIRKTQPPASARLTSWRSLNEGQPAGRGATISTLWQPIVYGDGQLGWSANIELPHRGHNYLELFIMWLDEEGSLHQQDATWTFHLCQPRRLSRFAACSVPTPA